MIIDILAILAWGILMVRYWFTGELRLLIHPNYFSLVFATGVFLLCLGILQIIYRRRLQDSNVASKSIGSVLLLITAILGLIVGPGLLTSKTALHRGVTNAMPITQTQIANFQISSKPEERSLVDWVRTLNAYPEPDAYVGEPVRVSGFVIHDTQLPENYLLVGRFIITCCAVDAYSVVLPVVLDEPRSSYPADSWIEVSGEMLSQTLQGERKLVIKANTITNIATPKDPYAY